MNTAEIKAKSESIIKELGLKANPALPVIEEIKQLSLRNAAEIARRLLVLGYLYGICFDVKRSKIKEDLKKYGLYQDLSPDEHKLLNKLFLSKQARINIAWVTESIEILGWAIGLWSEVDPLAQCNENRQAESIALMQDPTEFINNARLIDIESIHQQADLIYRLHWHAKRGKIGKLGDYSNEVYTERHKAINWLIGTAKDWDEVRTDT